jgi:hypothetical protein
MYNRSIGDRKRVLAKRARKGDFNYLHAQLVLDGATVARDEIVGRAHSYYFDCGCVRTYSDEVFSRTRELLVPCEKHEGLIAGAGSATSLLMTQSPEL